jgi:hypothetical protein
MSDSWLSRVVRASFMIVGALALLGCEREAPTVFCGKPAPKPGEGLNPLLKNRSVCYDDRATCERETGGCSADRPGWTCVTLKSSNGDPLSGISECWPSMRLCEAAHASRAAASECTAVDEVSCTTTNHVLMCYASVGDCDRAGDLTSRVLHVEKARCASRRD